MKTIEQNQDEITHDELIKLFQKNPLNIRNICVLAHVDHGKTSLVDSLISYSNIISPRMAGDVRYMDSRPDEQERCITMKSSSISLAYHSETMSDNFLLNLIDSPGHVDFSYEIFSALKMVDGALVLIDVVEGICSQTESVIRQAWDEKIKCVLVFNKIDKLITTVQLSPMEAYEHLNNLLEQVNALMASLIFRDIEVDRVINKTNNDNSNTNTNESNTKSNNDNEDNIDNIIDQKENDFYFSPEKGNVIFASALDNWAFTLDTFSEILCKKFKFKKETLLKVLWGNYYYSPKTKKLTTKPPTSKSKPLFVDFILQNIYSLYNSIIIEKDFPKIQKIIDSLQVNITSKEFNQINLNKNPSIILRSIMRQWLPIPKTIFDVVIRNLPNPIQGLSSKFSLLFPHSKTEGNDFVSKLKQQIDNNIIKGDNIPTIAYISKMVPINIANIQSYTPSFPSENNNNDIIFMAFARVFTGECKLGDELYVIGPKHEPKLNRYDIIKYRFNKLYYFMGQFLHPLNTVPAGNIFSIGGLETNVFKTATISNDFNCPSIIPLHINKNSNIKVSITTENIKDLPLLLEGIKKLNRSDPAVDYYVQNNGEHILTTSGEVHLERCLKDLEDSLAKVKIKTSAPIVNFKEGLANTNYTYKAVKQNRKEEILKLEEEMQVTKTKERKTEFEEKIIEGGEENIDIQDQEEVLKSSMPMIITVKDTQKKPTKYVKTKVKDVLSKNEKKTSHFIEKQNLNVTQKAFAEDTIPNKTCSFGISSIGMTQSMIEVIEQHQKLIDEIEHNRFEIDNEMYEELMKFKTKLLNSVESNKIKKLIENYLYAFGTKDGKVNMLLIKHISKKMNYFNRMIKLFKDNTEETCEIIVNEDNNDKKQRTENTINEHLKGQSSVTEFLHEIKVGFDMAVKNGPLCEENMYGVIFIVEYVKFKENEEDKKEETPSKSEDNKNDKDESNTLKNANQVTNDPNVQQTQSTSNELSLDNANLVLPKGDKEQDSKSLTSDLSKNKSSVYGPLLGQIMGTVKDCCRKAYLNGDPRLYEGLYLCLFQIKQENVGKIYSVVNKRRGEIINEIPGEENIMSTIEAVVPVAESFGFVEEIRKKSSGLTNPMLRFYKWRIIDVDPFDIISEEDLLNFGENANTMNIAKTYINKIRQRKGLVTDEKIVQGADKQRSLAKKR